MEGIPLPQDFGMGGVASIVQDNIRVQLHDLLDVQVALSIDRIAGLQNSGAIFFNTVSEMTDLKEPQ